MKSITYFNDNYLAQEPKLRSHYINQTNTGESNRFTNLKNYLKSYGPLPEGTSYLGLCNDGLPLFMDLGDSTSGSLMIVGDEPNRLVRFLRFFIASTMAINPPSIFRCSVISPNIGFFADLSQTGHMEKMYSSFETAAFEHIVDLAILAEQRRSGRHTGVIHLLIIDDLIQILKYRDFDTLNHLSWLISNGPRNSVWTAATIDRNSLSIADKKIISTFGTYIFNNPIFDRAPILGPGNGSLVDNFTTQIGSQSIHFHLPNFE